MGALSKNYRFSKVQVYSIVDKKQKSTFGRRIWSIQNSLFIRINSCPSRPVRWGTINPATTLLPVRCRVYLLLGVKWSQKAREKASEISLVLPTKWYYKNFLSELIVMVLKRNRVDVFILLLFASLPDCSQNRIAVSDTLRFLSDF